MENNLRRSLHVLLGSAMKEKEEFINKLCEIIERKECECAIDIESGKRIDKKQCECTTSGECCCGDDCKCKTSHHHKHTAHAITRELEKLSISINELNETLKQNKREH